MPVAMLTLFLSFLGEADYKSVITTLYHVDSFHCAIYILFVLFVAIAMANVIAGVFVTDTIEMVTQDRELRQRGELMRSRKNMQILSTLFQELDRSGEGLLTRETFEAQLHKPDVQALFSYFSFDILDAAAFFTLLDVDGNGTVD
eukprot:CAMPEP_0194543392 /NCGR_PEP_ID=MMETSP0253-20130528/85731_1 /TAXON_ID=2966 /ORGANISM="Noctiluca scintillans" /LENGTH=144 /DNA_ID=CAMNT_0039390149 /DNA_START=273 /DNA_END=704 /DNA_ORIENTATION=+